MSNRRVVGFDLLASRQFLRDDITDFLSDEYLSLTANSEEIMWDKL